MDTSKHLSFFSRIWPVCRSPHARVTEVYPHLCNGLVLWGACANNQLMRTSGRDIHSYETRGRDSYRTGKHRTVVYEHLPSQAGVHFIDKLPNWIKHVKTPKALKTRLKRFWHHKRFMMSTSFWYVTGRPPNQKIDYVTGDGKIGDCMEN
ncbi:hypothetical protein J6590_012508 [Homalodisca vitripennis]|nr:hypothetical protein J6590_012508 [Homalodisca vitripennis]